MNSRLILGSLLALSILSACQSTSSTSSSSENKPGFKSYTDLKAQGYRQGPLKYSGGYGYDLTGKDGKYYCRVDSSILEVSPGKYGIYSNGKLIEISLDYYRQYTGRTDFTPPKMSNLRAGRPKPADMGRCHFTGKV